MSDNHVSIIQYIMNSSGLPPSFEGNYYIFVSALFCTMFASLISLVQIYTIGREISRVPDKMKSPLNVYRVSLILMYLTILIIGGPDAVYLWTYGEVDAKTTALILNIYRICDSIFLIPFMIFTWLQIKSGPVLRYQLIHNAIPLGFKSYPSTIRKNVFAAILILLMSIGVTLSK